MSTIYEPIGITVPIVRGEGGYFNQSFDTNEKVKQNLENFLKTKRGERRMLPEFGTKMYQVLFEQNDPNLIEITKNILRDEISYWIPEVTIESISIINEENEGNVDNYNIVISIVYAVIQTNHVDTLTFELKRIRI